MTVRETASFYAALLLPGSWAPSARRERVALVLSVMGLSLTEDTLVSVARCALAPDICIPHARCSCPKP